MTDADMETNGSITELINLAFQLAYFIHDDRAIAMHVAISAFRKLKVASTAQGRRVYYIPTGQSGYRAVRTKVSLSDLHILQRLIYIESEIYERLGEEKHRETLGQMDMIIRFIKHLVKITIKRNSFYVSLGMSRVLYNYTTAEAIEIYNFVIQDPDRARENYYYRSQKAYLMGELKERFGEMLRIRKAKHREERFEVQEDSEPFGELVKTCLLRFTPWESKCVLPGSFDPTINTVVPLLFKGTDPDQEHTIELNRIHTLLHPDCFHRLAIALGLDVPDQRLEVPHFFMSNDDRGSLGQRFHPPSLSEEELHIISDRIEKESSRRKKNSGRLLSILVDGVEGARLDLKRTTSLLVPIEADAELIEVRTLDSSDEILLATHLVNQHESGILPSKSEVTLEGGQSLSFEIANAGKSSSEASRALLSICYRETQPMRALVLFLQQLGFDLSSRFKIRNWRKALTSKPAQALLFLTVGIALLLVYYQVINQRPQQPTVIVENEPDAPNGDPLSEPPPQELPSTRPSSKIPIPAPSPGGRTSANTNSDADRTRAPKHRTNPIALLAVKRIYINTADDESLSRQIRELLGRGLQSQNRFVIVAKQEEADAMLDISAIQALDEGMVSLVLQLVNAQGQALWPKDRRKYSGRPAEVTDRALKELRIEIQRLEKIR